MLQRQAPADGSMPATMPRAVRRVAAGGSARSARDWTGGRSAKARPPRRSSEVQGLMAIASYMAEPSKPHRRRSHLLARFLMLVLVSFAFTARPAMAQSILRDAETEALFRDMSKPLVEAAGLSPRNVQIVLIHDKSINAFVAGGQIVYIHSGLDPLAGQRVGARVAVVLRDGVAEFLVLELLEEGDRALAADPGLGEEARAGRVGGRIPGCG